MKYCFALGLAGERRRTKKGKPKRPSKKSIFEIYEPSELKRSHFTDLDNEVCIMVLFCYFNLLHGRKIPIGKRTERWREWDAMSKSEKATS